MLIWEEGESRRLIGPKDWILSIVKGLDNERPHLNRFTPLSTLDKKSRGISRGAEMYTVDSATPKEKHYFLLIQSPH